MHAMNNIPANSQPEFASARNDTPVASPPKHAMTDVRFDPSADYGRIELQNRPPVVNHQYGPAPVSVSDANEHHQSDDIVPVGPIYESVLPTHAAKDDSHYLAI